MIDEFTISSDDTGPLDVMEIIMKQINEHVGGVKIEFFDENDSDFNIRITQEENYFVATGN